MREKSYAELNTKVPPVIGDWFPKSVISSGICSCRMPNDISVVTDSTAAVKVWRLQTPATVGSPICDEECHQRRQNLAAWVLLTAKKVFMNASQLDVCFG